MSEPVVTRGIEWSKPEPKVLDVNGLSQDIHDPYVLRLHFRKPVTEKDRQDILFAINAYTAVNRALED